MIDIGHLFGLNNLTEDNSLNKNVYINNDSFNAHMIYCLTSFFSFNDSNFSNIVLFHLKFYTSLWLSLLDFFQTYNYASMNIEVSGETLNKYLKPDGPDMDEPYYGINLSQLFEDCLSFKPFKVEFYANYIMFTHTSYMIFKAAFMFTDFYTNPNIKEICSSHSYDQKINKNIVQKISFEQDVIVDTFKDKSGVDCFYFSKITSDFFGVYSTPVGNFIYVEYDISNIQEYVSYTTYKRVPEKELRLSNGDIVDVKPPVLKKVVSFYFENKEVYTFLLEKMKNSNLVLIAISNFIVINNIKIGRLML